MSFATPLIKAIGETCYLLTRVLGARNAVTQWPVITYTGDYAGDDFDCDDFVCATEVKIIMNLIQVSEQNLPAGRISIERQQGFLPGDVTVNHLDRIEYHDILYEVESTEATEWHLAEAGYQRVNLVRISE